MAEFKFSNFKKEVLFHSPFGWFLLYRMTSLIFIQTVYVPDEYWQSLEVAHNMAFGYGHLTWEWKYGLRSYLYPFCFYLLYKILYFLHLDFPFLIILVPKIFQAFITATSDLYFYLLCKNFGYSGYWAKVSLFTNWFWYYCGFRTITNTFETTFTIIAFYYYPWSLFLNGMKNKVDVTLKKNTVKYLTLSAINCAVRPTAIILWGPLIVLQWLFMQRKHKNFFFKYTLSVLLISFTSSIIIDSIWYGKIIIPPYNFITFNILKNISSFYGTHSYHWYISQGLPVVLGLQCLPFLQGVVIICLDLLKNKKNPLKNLYCIWIFLFLLNVIILSNIPHKEFRFILPLLPLMMLIIVKTSSDYFTTSRTKLKLCWIGFLGVKFLIMCLLFGVFHQRGTLKVMDYLRDSVKDCSPNCFFVFLMPCHSTPLYSHLHANVSTRFLHCEPPLNGHDYDESEHFFNNPNIWLNHFWKNKVNPSHIVFFDNIEESISIFLKEKGYTKTKVFFHTLFSEKNIGHYILVYS